MAKFNYKAVAQAIATSDIGRKRIQTVMENRFRDAKAQLLRDFDEHPVTKEIEAGIGAANISETLDGEGDLYSFIGFEDGSDPIEDLRYVLESQTQLGKGRLRAESGSIKFNFSLRVPREEIKKATPLPWEGGKSWAEGVEKGISGFSEYMQGKFTTSRSGGGIQTTRTIRATPFKRRPYLTEIFNNFVENF